MKKIQPVSIWSNGQSKFAEYFDLRIIADDLQSSATFYYQLQEKVVDEEGNESAGPALAVGNLSISDPEYDTWDGSNSWAYDWAASQLNIVIVG